jgi:YggT family protein
MTGFGFGWQGFHARRGLRKAVAALRSDEIVNKGPVLMTSLFQILMLLLSVAKFFILAHVIMSWLISFQVLNLHQQFVAQVWYMLNRVLEPLYSRIRRILPPMSGIDLAPLVALLGVFALQIILRNNMMMFY